MTVGFQPRVLSEKKLPRRRNLYEGTTKSIFEGVDPGTFILYFKDDHPRNRLGEETLPALSGKGVINNRLSELLFERLSEINIDHHFVSRLNMREQVVRMAENLPFYVEVHNASCDDFVTRFNYQRHTALPETIVELRFKNKSADDPVVAPQHLIAFGLSDEDELDQLFQNVTRINDFLIGQFSAHDLRLLRYKLEFGRVYFSENPMDTRLILIDEISLDTCRILDRLSKQRLDALATPDKEDEDAVAEMEEDGLRTAMQEASVLDNQSAQSIFDPAIDEEAQKDDALSKIRQRFQNVNHSKQSTQGHQDSLGNSLHQLEEACTPFSELGIEGYYEIARRFKIIPTLLKEEIE